ncbi:MAG: hypothetical protein AAFP19_26910, partial [Bacteroidota bacterium]
MELSNLECLLSLSTSWALFGLIWTIQLSHYPSFSYIDIQQFNDFHGHHTRSITLIVMPLMLLELGLSIWMARSFDMLWLIPLIMVILIWASTFFIQIPLHNQLASGKDMAAIKQLVQTNWIVLIQLVCT